MRFEICVLRAFLGLQILCSPDLFGVKYFGEDFFFFWGGGGGSAKGVAILYRGKATFGGPLDSFRCGFSLIRLLGLAIWPH